MRTASGLAIALLIAAAGPRAQNPQAQAEYAAQTKRMRDTAVREFQESPSLARFAEAGMMIMVASGWANAPNRVETDTPPRDPEFERMKASLAKGVMVSPSAIPPQESYLVPEMRVTPAMLPAIQPSFFKSGEVVFAIPLRPLKLIDPHDAVALVDALSAVNRITMRIRTIGPIAFGNDGPNGAWDVASVEARYEQDAAVHGLSPDGRPTGYRVRSVRTPIGGRFCFDREGSVIGTRFNPDWDASIVAWIGTAPPGQAMITSSQTGRGLERVMAQRIDIDRDSVPDLFIWTGSKMNLLEDTVVPWKVVFMNIGGKWVSGGYRASPDCT